MSKMGLNNSRKTKDLKNGGVILLITLVIYFVVVLIGMLIQYLINTSTSKLDEAFGNNGLVTTDFNQFADRVNGITEQPDGKIVVIGVKATLLSSDSLENEDVSLARYNHDGSLDITFGENGKSIVDLGGLDEGFSVVIQSGGSIVTASQTCSLDSTDCKVVLVRLDSNGSVDKTFGEAGKQVLEIGGLFHKAPRGLLITPQGNILVAGSVWNGADYDFAVYRLNENGIIDTEFGTNGLVVVEFGVGRTDMASDLALQDDKIVVVGSSCDANNESLCKFGLARLNSNGNLDKSFNGNGKNTTKFNASSIPLAIAVQPDGKLIVVGDKEGETNMFALAKYKPNGILDFSFSGDGKLSESFFAGIDAWAKDVMIQPDGKIVIIGYTAVGADPSDFATRRYESNGNIDTRFGENGNLVINFGSQDYGSAILFSRDEMYVVAGETSNGEQSDFALARIMP